MGSLYSAELEEQPERRALLHMVCGSAGGCAGTLLSFPADVLQGSLVCGALAGVATKTILYPLDVVKKRLQVSGWSEGRAGLGETPQYSSMRDCVAKIVRQEGGRALYKGFTPALIKAVSTSSIHFMSYEW